MKKQDLKHDIFREYIMKCVQYFNENSAIIFKIFVVIILGVGGTSYYKHIGSSKIESAAHLAGKAQNIFINGNLDEAMVKFYRVLNDYPGTPGAIQSLVYLLNDAISNNDLEEVKILLTENDGTVEDPIVLGAILKLRGDISFLQENYSDAIKYYQKAHSGNSSNTLKVKYGLNVATSFLAQNDYEDALRTLEKIIDKEDLGFNEKNTAEELMAYTKQKMGI